jgi:hypothetical protein
MMIIGISQPIFIHRLQRLFHWCICKICYHFYWINAWLLPLYFCFLTLNNLIASGWFVLQNTQMINLLVSFHSVSCQLHWSMASTKRNVSHMQIYREVEKAGKHRERVRWFRYCVVLFQYGCKVCKVLSYISMYICWNWFIPLAWHEYLRM